MSETNSSIWSVYFIRMRSNALYCGITTNVSRRFLQHQKGTGAKALKGKGPLSLVWSCAIGESRGLATQIEYQLKQHNKNTKEALICGQLQLSDIIQPDLYLKINQPV